MEHFNLDYPIFEFSDDPRDHWTFRNAVEGLQIFGSVGSGKTSGSGRIVSRKYLAAGMGGLVLTVKPTEKNDWIAYCKDAGREDDLIIVEPGGEHAFDFLDYESNSPGSGNAITQNIVELLKTVISAGQHRAGKTSDPFWEDALMSLIACTVDACKLAKGRVTVKEMYDFVMSIPHVDEHGHDIQSDNTTFHDTMVKIQNVVQVQISEWQKTQDPAEIQRLKKTGLYELKLMEVFPDAHTLSIINQFFETYIKMNDKTRGIIDFSFLGFLFRLLKGPIYETFCSKPSTFVPEDCFDGKIILINFPVKTFFNAGREIQMAVKYIWQRAMERRNVEDYPLPVFLWCDEAQLFLHPYDTDFKATARSSRVATVYLSQNLSNYMAMMPGDNGQHKVRAFLATMNTKIFHSNSDEATNSYASALIGDYYKTDVSKGTSINQDVTISQNKSKKLEKLVRPEQFAKLRTGTQINDFYVTGILHKSGTPFSDNLNYTDFIVKQQ